MRILKTLFSILILIPLSPFLLIISILIKIDSKGPILHWSKRVGKNNVIFLMPKFRTMEVDSPQLATHLMAKEKSYVTKVGGVLRKLSLDELPQLFSIIKGDMNFIGPRPALFNQEDLIELRTQNNIHLMSPGITGWAQVNGRDEISIEEKVRYEKEYLDIKSPTLDLKILFLTFFSVILKKGVTH